MAATEILPIANTSEESDPMTIEAGETVAVMLKGTDGEVPAGAQVIIKLVDDDNNSYSVGKLTPGQPRVLDVPGDYVFERVAGKSVGVFRAG